MTMTSRLSYTTILLLLCAPTAGTARQVDAAALPDAVADRVVAFYNNPRTIRLADAYVAPGTAISGPVAVLGGRLTLGGRIDGELVVINGDVHVERTAEVTGRITLVGSTIAGPGATALAFDRYREPLRFRQEAGGIARAAPRLADELAAGRELPFGRSELLLTIPNSYNRVEGLPIAIGPRIRIGSRNALTGEALVHYRSAAGIRLDTDQIGYSVRLQQAMGGPAATHFGFRAYSEIVPIEATLTRIEASLATFLLHRDYRDHYERQGWAAYADFGRIGRPYRISFEYRDERHATVAPAQPWSLVDNQEPWRPQPLAAEGTLRSATAGLLYDSRNEPRDPATGWHIRAGLEQGLGGTLRYADGTPAPATFSAGSIDVRWYARLNPWSRIALRTFTAGTLDAGELPAQRQHALGGEGSLPGFQPFRFDCGARASTFDVGETAFHPAYGCDRVALVQFEYQANFPWARRLTERVSGAQSIAHIVRWAAFFNGGRAWTEPSARGAIRTGGNDFSADVGLGLRLGAFGLYWAVPLSGDGSGSNLFLRIGSRI
jgi:hypothetical protein